MRQLLIRTFFILTCISQSTNAAFIIFDVGGVLLRPNTRKALSHLGYTNLALYTLWGNNPLAIKDTFFTLLNTAPEIAPHHVPTFHEGQPLPPLMASWLRGDLPCTVLLEHAYATIKKHVSWDRERALFEHVADITFNPKILCDIMVPIPEGMQLARQCHDLVDASGQRKHQLYILSNMNPEVGERLLATYPELFDLFDGIVFSGTVHCNKPDPAIYEHLLTEYQLTPGNCFFIDDQKENITAAEQLGITCAQCLNEDFSAIRSRMEELALL